MSYILDALKKSDQQRQVGTAPTLLTVQTTATQPKQQAYWVYGVLAAVLLGAGMAIGWKQPWQTWQTPPAAVPPLLKPLEAQPHPSQFIAPPPPLETGNAPHPHSAPPASAAQDNDRKPAATREHGVTETHRIPPQADAPHAAKDASAMGGKPPEKDAVNGAQEADAMQLAELPPSIRQEIPKITVALHAYANKPQDRLVSVNDMLLREGDYLAPGLKLERITPAGMILSYKGYRFRSE